MKPTRGSFWLEQKALENSLHGLEVRHPTYVPVDGSLGHEFLGCSWNHCTGMVLTSLSSPNLRPFSALLQGGTTRPNTRTDRNYPAEQVTALCSSTTPSRNIKVKKWFSPWHQLCGRGLPRAPASCFHGKGSGALPRLVSPRAVLILALKTN